MECFEEQINEWINRNEEDIMSRAILTLPMMPVDGTNYGKYVTPIICETLRDIYNGKYYQCINLLDSFNDREANLKNYISSLNNNGIRYDYLWYDKNNIDKFLKNVDRLIKTGYIFELETVIYTCNCGVVEIEEHKIPSCNQQNLKFEIKGNNMYCKECGGECEKHQEKVLAFVPHNVKREQILFVPTYLNKDLKTYDNTVINSYTTISRKRNTGISIKYNGKVYNIDIDFLWATYLADFKETEKIIVSGNRMIYQLFLVGVIEKCLASNNKTVFFGTPYITNIRNITSNRDFIDDEYLRKLAILFNLKWSKKEKNYDETILKYLNSMSKDKRKQLYDIISKDRINVDVLYDDMKDLLLHQLNMQECVKQLKKERR